MRALPREQAKEEDKTKKPEEPCDGERHHDNGNPVPLHNHPGSGLRDSVIVSLSSSRIQASAPD